MLMKKNPYAFFFCLLIFSSCRRPFQKKTVFEPELILKSIDNRDNYINYYLKLSNNFIAYDTAYNLVTKGEFLKALSSGKYLPVWLKSTDSLLYYKLYKLGPHVDRRFTLGFKQIGEICYENYKREGEKFPQFNYIDLNGHVYNNKIVKGKILVIDCWFVACGSCVAGMPQLNKIAHQYKNRDDILFISLDNDQKFNAVHFLKTTRFDFAVIPLPDDYFTNILKVNTYPSTFIINKRGFISKIVTNPEELLTALKKEIAK